MYKNILYVISFLLMLSAVSASAQQLEGNWKLNTVEFEKRDFWNNGVLAQWSVAGDSLNNIRVMVYTSLSFTDSTCVTQHGLSTETWAYSKAADHFTLSDRNSATSIVTTIDINKDIKKDVPSAVQVVYKYEFEGKKYLLVGPMVVSYADKLTGQPVKIAYRCRYEASK
ncbi:hypothetical protein ACE38W_09980 [Chitinophaga sp. Hz27]|uniref:hypothetical protein n=1 Tax=Chitinophaga sp. Hz27 TaxID=3347169 RepID=UPI0035DEE7EE